MPIVKLTLSEEQYQKLMEKAKDKRKSAQQYICDIIFNEISIFTPQEAIRRAKEKFSSGEPFSISDLYSEEEWKGIGRGPAGVLGKRFYKYIIENEDENIVFIDMGKYNRRAVYKVNDKGCDKVG